MARRWTQPQHRPDPARIARTAATGLVDRPDWWAQARLVKRAMRRASAHDPANAGLWRDARREFRHLATRRGLAEIGGAV